MQDVPTSTTGLALVRQRFGSVAWRLRSTRLWLAVGVLLALLIVVVSILKSDGPSVPAIVVPARNPGATSHAPPFITPPGSADVLLIVMAAVLVIAVLAIGVFFFWLHSLPERLVHKSTKAHFDIVAVLALLSLFTHVHLFWVAALLLALVRIPDLTFPYLSSLLHRMTVSLEKMADGKPRRSEAGADGRGGPTSDEGR